MKKRDYKQFPDDGTGDVLWNLRTDGDALTEKREIDFSAIFPSKEAAAEFADAFKQMKYRVELDRLSQPDDGRRWHVLVYLDEVPTHSRITRFETLLEKRAARLDGHTWGWSATFVPSKDPSVVKELWWNYLGRYENGLLGLIQINLGLIQHAPMRALPILLTTGVSYESDPKEPESKLPSKRELSALNRLEKAGR